MSFVLDSSTALAWALPDERAGDAVSLLSRRGAANGLWVPALWWYEVANALASAQRRRRITEAEGARVIELLGEVPIRTDNLLEPHGLGRLRSLALEHGLSAYDCAYLELAQRKGLALATRDVRLAAAASSSGVAVL